MEGHQAREIEGPTLSTIRIYSPRSEDMCISLPDTYSSERVTKYIARILGCLPSELRHREGDDAVFYDPAKSFFRWTDYRDFVEADEQTYPLLPIEVCLPAWGGTGEKKVSLTVKIIRERPGGCVVKLPGREFLHRGSGPTLPCLYYLLRDDKTLHPFSVHRVPIGFEYVLANCTDLPPIEIHYPATWKVMPIRKEECCMYCLDKPPDMVCACPERHMAVCYDCHFSKEHFCPQCNAPVTMYRVSRYTYRELP